MPVLDAATITAALRELPDWHHQDGALVKEFTLDGFMGSVMFVNRLAGAAEQADHHPDIDIRWNRVTVRWSTHSQGGVTRRDLDMASRTDGLT
jgi:4a-hydroxytetrahydrobiopterin dehydratase